MDSCSKRKKEGILVNNINRRHPKEISSVTIEIYDHINSMQIDVVKGVSILVDKYPLIIANPLITTFIGNCYILQIISDLPRQTKTSDESIIKHKI